MTLEMNFPPQLPEYFTKLLSENRNSDPIHLNKLVDDYLIFAKESLQQNEFIDIESATLLTEVCHYLISELANLSDDDLKYVVAAIYYFVESNDEVHDLDSIFGFEDDIEVLNYVLDKIGHAHKKIKI